MSGRPRIGPKRPRKIYLAEWRDKRGLTQEQLAMRFDPVITGMTVSRWERGEALLNTNVMAAIAEKLDIEPQDLYRHPDQPSADELLRGATPDEKDRAIKVIEALVSQKSA